MIASSRRLVEELGITHRLLEADLFAGLIELLEGDAGAAERFLRPAYEGLREQGLGIDAARAAAFLGSALPARGRLEEAEALSRESEALAGDDLQAAIAWRGVRAEALARRGEPAAAVEIARAAVDVAAATDALLDHADARLALSVALRAAGRPTEAAAEEARAADLWEAKGATVLAARVRRAPATGDAATGAATRPAPGARRVRTNAAENAAPSGGRRRARHRHAGRTDRRGAIVHHPTGHSYSHDEIPRDVRALFAATDFVHTHVILATPGDRCPSFACGSGERSAVESGRRRASRSSCPGRWAGRLRYSGFFAPERFDALAQLYTLGRTAPDGPRAAAPRPPAVAAFLGALDPTRSPA
jgi:tetratricopeptide (TPR) repeat protein